MIPDPGDARNGCRFGTAVLYGGRETGLARTPIPNFGLKTYAGIAGGCW